MHQLDKDLPDINNPAFYNNREVSWLRFNQRVLEEAINDNNPLLERLRFISIFSSNLDEFFMVRVAGLKDQVRANFNEPDNKSGLTPAEQLVAISRDTHTFVQTQQVYYKRLLKELESKGIKVATSEQLRTSEQKWLKDYFEKFIFPTLTPIAIDIYRPFPLLANLSLNIAVQLTSEEEPEKSKSAFIQVPELFNRFIQIKDSLQFILLEDVIIYFLAEIFPGYRIDSATAFRITRNADMQVYEEDARDLLQAIESELYKREWGPVVRLEVSASNYDENILSFLKSMFNIGEEDVYLHDGPLDFTALNRLFDALALNFSDLVYPILVPQQSPEIDLDKSIFEQLKERDIMLHHPYHTFDPVIELLREASIDPDVLAIKQTLYRVSENSPIIKYLELAARNGKQVTVLVELKARFDEKNNVNWAKQLERSGCHVIYGLSGLKTHSKICLVVKKEANKIERFLHLGTGNYNEETAKLYTDLSIMTSRESLAVDATHFFNFLSGAIKVPNYTHLSMAPTMMHEDFLAHIDQEIAYQKQFGTGRIIAKMNALTDKSIIIKLYQASQVGVKIDLIVRGICCLKPGITGISENIKVHSIVGRFLEHSRIYYFHKNGNEAYYLSSADWMTRNLHRRIELLFPVLDKAHQKSIKNILDISLRDNTNRRKQNELGLYYSRVAKDDEPIINSQLTFYKNAYEQAEKRKKSLN